MEASPPRGPSTGRPQALKLGHSAGTAVADQKTKTVSFAPTTPKDAPKSSGFRRSVKTGLAAGAADDPRGVSPASPNDARQRQNFRVASRVGGMAVNGVVTDAGEIDLEAEELAAMEKAMEIQQEALRAKREKFKRRQQQQMHKRADELQKRLLALEEAEKQERKVRLAMRSKLHKLRDRDTEENEEEKELSDQLWQFERDSQIEEITVLKMQVEALRMKREKMEMLSDRSIVQVEAIEDVLISRGTGDYEKLQQILSKADTLKASMLKGDLEGPLFSDADRRNTATRVVEEQKADGARDDDMFRLADEVQMRRRKQREKERHERAEKLALLNKQRKEITDAQLNQVRKEKDHRIMMEKGLDFLVDVELGKAPPIDVILANARNGEEEIVLDSDIESDEDREDFITTVQHRMDEIPMTIEELDAEMKALENERKWAQSDDAARAKPYDGSLGARSYHPDQIPVYRIVHEIVEDLAEKVTERLVTRPTIKDVKKVVADFEFSKQRRLARRNEERIERSVRSVNNEILMEMVHDLAGSICVEQKEVQKRATVAARNILIEAFDVSNTVRPMLNPVLEELVTRRQINDNKNKSRVAHHSTRLRFGHTGKDLTPAQIAEQAKKEAEEDASRASGQGKRADDVDYDTILLPDSDVFPRRVLPDTSLLKMEDDYWSKFNMKWTGHAFPAKAGACTVACESDNGRFIFTGHANGAVIFWDCVGPEPLIIRMDLRNDIPPEARVEVTQAKYGSGGGGGRVITLDKNFIIRVWTTEIAEQTGKKQSRKMFPAKIQDYAKKPKAPQCICVLSAKSFARSGVDPKDLTPLTPTAICFHSAMTITGQMPSLMIGMQGGTICKWNLNSDGPVLCDEPVEIVSDSINPITQGKNLEKEERRAKSNLTDCGNETRPSVEREFFQAHHTTVELISIVGTSSDHHDPTTKIVSVDKSGMIITWSYSKDSYSGFGWFVPTSKYKLRSIYAGGEKPMHVHMVEVNMNKSRTQLIFMVHAREITRKEHSGDDAGSGDVFDDDALGFDENDLEAHLSGSQGDLELFIFDIQAGCFATRSITVDPQTAMSKSPPAFDMSPLAWEEDEMMIRLYTAAAEQRCRSIQWDIGEHNVYREILGLVLEIVNKAMERSEENKVNKNFVDDDSDED
eukprot:g1075.t1